jgi:CubicO group peptidase (beta-lactamase class C family)
MLKAKVDIPMIDGWAAPGFEEVKAEFEKNFTRRDELGAACAIYYQDNKVVDLWGGYRDHKTRAPWEEDTMVLVFSTTKGVAAMTIAVANSLGLLDYDEKVCTYWPEFAQEGKESVTVRQLLSHQAGLSAIDEPLGLEVLADLDVLAEILARQKPAWEPGTKQGYHCWDLGWYQSELMRRVDPQHRSLGQFFQDEIAQPLGLEFYIGLPPHIPDSRIATIKPARLAKVLMNLDKLPYLKLCMNPFKSSTITYRTVMNPRILTNHANYNRRDVRSVEIPSANGIGQVRSIAKAYSVFASGGKALHLEEETLKAIIAPPIPPSSGLCDEVMLIDQCYSLGFCRPFKDAQFGLSERSFGFSGAGGSFAFADPDAQVGYAYAPNRIDVYGFGDPREEALRTAFYGCLSRISAYDHHTTPKNINRSQTPLSTAER